MRKIRNGLVILVALLIISVIALTLAINPIVKKYRPDIETKIAEAIGKQITFEELSVQLFPYVGISLSDVKIVNDPDQNRVGKLVLRANLLDLLEGAVTVSELSLTGASATIVKAKDGTLSVGGIQIAAKKEPTNKADTQKMAASEHSEKTSALALNVNEATVAGTSIKWIDNSIEPTQTFEISAIRASILDISALGTGTVEIGATILNSKENLHLNGSVGTALGANGLPSLDLRFSLDELDLKKVEQLAKGYSKELKGLPITQPFSVKGTLKSGEDGLKIDANINGNQPLALSVNLLSAKDLKGTATVTTDKLSFSQFSAALPAIEKFKDSSFSDFKITSKFKLEPRDIEAEISSGAGSLAGAVLQKISLSALIKGEETTIKPSTINGLGGIIKFSGSISQAADKQLNFSLDGEKLDLKEISKVALRDVPLSLEGSVTKITAKIKGNQTEIPNSLNGNIAIDAVDGAIVGFNFLGEIIGAVELIPGIGESLESAIPEQYRGLLKGDSTKFDSITGRILLGDGEAKIQQFDLNHSLYIITIKGYSKFNGRFRLEGALKLTPAMTEKMIERKPKLRLLLDQSGNLTIPVVLSRETTGSVKVYPDTKELAKNAAKGAVEEKASKALNKISPGLGGITKGLGGLFK